MSSNAPRAGGTASAQARPGHVVSVPSELHSAGECGDHAWPWSEETDASWLEHDAVRNVSENAMAVNMLVDLRVVVSDGQKSSMST